MKLIDCRITFLFNHDGAEIEVHDYSASITFLNLKLNAKQLSIAFSRLGYAPVESAEVFGLEKINKKMVHKGFEFPIPKELEWHNWHKNRDVIKNIAIKKCPKGCKPDLHFNSSGSFFIKNGKTYARTIIRKWVDSKKHKLTIKEES